MTTRFSFILLFLILCVFGAFTSKNKDNKTPQYAMLYENYFGLGMSEMEIIYENGDKEDVLKKLNIKINAGWNKEDNFLSEAKSFKYLNEKGYSLLSYSYDYKNKDCTYIFIKSN